MVCGKKQPKRENEGRTSNNLTRSEAAILELTHDTFWVYTLWLHLGILSNQMINIPPLQKLWAIWVLIWLMACGIVSVVALKKTASD